MNREVIAAPRPGLDMRRHYGHYQSPAIRAGGLKKGVGVSVIMPGFIKSQMTAGNKFPMPFLMEADRAARIVRRGLERNRPRIAFPWPMACLAWFIGILSPGLIDPILDRLPKKD